MRADFLDDVWINGMIILDTCTLDFIERCDICIAKKIMDILLIKKETVYVPYHVKEHEMKKYFESGKKKKSMTKKMQKFKEDVIEIYDNQELDEKDKKRKIISIGQKFINKQLKKYEFTNISTEMEKILKKDLHSIINILKSDKMSYYLNEYDDFLHSETVRDFYNIIMNNTFPKMDNDLLEDIKMEGILRQEKNLPPGCGDINKCENPYGDFIIWKEILMNVKNKKNKCAIFITEDKKKKSNWFDPSQSKMHEYLYEEVLNEYGYEAINITTLAIFINGAGKYVNENIDDLVKYLNKQNIQVEEAVVDYLENEASQYLGEKAWEAITQEYDVDYSEPESGFEVNIDLDDIEYIIDERVEVNTNVFIEFSVDNNIKWGGDNWESVGDSVSANLMLTLSIGILEGEYSDRIYSLDMNDIDCKINSCEVVDFDAPFDMDEPDEEYDDYEIELDDYIEIDDYEEEDYYEEGDYNDYEEMFYEREDED